jgi:integrase
MAISVSVQKIERRSAQQYKQRHHVLESGLQKAVKRATKDMGMLKRVGCHTLRHCFATHALEYCKHRF